MFNSAIIKKGKAEKANKAKKVKPSLLHGMEELEAKEKFETSESAESYDIPKAKITGESKVPSAKKASSEDLVGIDLIMAGAKKKPKLIGEASLGETEVKETSKSEKYKKLIKSRSGK